MRLRDLIPDSITVNALEPEELAVAVLEHLNVLVAQDNQYKRNKIISKNYFMYESQAYEKNGQSGCKHALACAWEHLRSTGMVAVHPDAENDCYFLTPRSLEIKTKADYERFRKASLYPRGSIHPVIEKETHAEFLRGDYETAVFKAYKAVEVAARQHSGAPSEVIGVDLMNKAFNPERGPLRDADEVRSEQISLMELFRGAIGRFKNPSSHREVNFDDAAEVIAILQLAGLLLRIIDRRAAANAARVG